MTSASLITTPLTLVLGPRNRVQRALAGVLAAADPASVGSCSACGTALDRGDGIRYRGDYYHAGPCRRTTPRPQTTDASALSGGRAADGTTGSPILTS